jgi:hypothetical protein
MIFIKLLDMLVWFFIFYIGYQVVKFLLKVGRTVNKINNNNTQQTQKRAGTRNPANIIEAEFVEIESEIHKKPGNN